MEEHEAERRRAAWRYLRRLIVRERRGVLGAIAGGLIWQGAAVTTPLVVERAIDRGIVPEDHQALLLWCGGLVLLGLIEASAGGMRHFFAIRFFQHRPIHGRLRFHPMVLLSPMFITQAMVQLVISGWSPRRVENRAN